ncbi:hypothetical protein [Roseateles albus]|uniref:Uncharacterized protein n=1 Tax=Roseateles albus TaxID=2987525 RepID=A0ABT5K890_9BURK|nr:hypothetical protein [Roseateles albus]MDC8770172.1 hypothetical protein [Roseateles albus]
MNSVAGHNHWLLLGAGLSAIAALLHVAIIFGGGDWYRFFGAGEAMARMAEAGRSYPALVTTGIALLLSVWSAYALAGAGWALAAGLPWIKAALIAITGVYLLRGLAPLPLWLLAPAQVTPFWIWSSLICGVFGLVHLIGLIQVWGRL